MNGQHTPGPWRAVEPHADGLWGVLGADGYPMLVLSTIREPAQANVRLIAAAPEMYAALKATSDGGMADGYSRTQIFDQIDAAIAKAEGREP